MQTITYFGTTYSVRYDSDKPMRDAEGKIIPFPRKHKQKTVCTLLDKDGNEVISRFAECGPKDAYSREIGEDISLDRCLNALHKREKDSVKKSIWSRRKNSGVKKPKQVAKADTETTLPIAKVSSVPPTVVQKAASTGRKKPAVKKSANSAS